MSNLRPTFTNIWLAETLAATSVKLIDLDLIEMRGQMHDCFDHEDGAKETIDGMDDIGIILLVARTFADGWDHNGVRMLTPTELRQIAKGEAV